MFVYFCRKGFVFCCGVIDIVVGEVCVEVLLVMVCLWVCMLFWYYWKYGRLKFILCLNMF